MARSGSIVWRNIENVIAKIKHGNMPAVSCKILRIRVRHVCDIRDICRRRPLSKRDGDNIIYRAINAKSGSSMAHGKRQAAQ